MSVGEILRRTFVPAIDSTAPLQGPLSEAGGVMRLQSLPQADVDHYVQMLSTASRYRLSRAEIREALRRLAYTNIAQILTRYLGSLWSADYGLVWRAPPQSTSGTWHHDNVGNRVKVFVILANESPENGTEFVPFTHKTRWKSFAGRLPEPDGKPLFPRQGPGDVLLFDTNTIHRGRYSLQERIILQIEFTNILKSFLVPGQCGRYFRGTDADGKYAQRT